MDKLILASSSPRRRQLLAEAGYAFEVVEPSEDAECGVCSNEGPAMLVARRACEKAADVRRRIRQGVVVACDTVAECGGQIFGKPADQDHARQMLRQLRGREHRVYSGLCVLPAAPAAGDREDAIDADVRVAVTTLRMDRLDDGAVEDYLESNAWRGKAGAFGYQDRLGWVHVVAGSPSNVVGLPLELLAEMLARIPAR